MLEQTNATVLRVAGSSTGENFDGPAAAGADKWVAPDGELPNAYLRERRDRLTTPGGQQRSLDRLLIVETGTPAVDWRSGDIVTFSYRGEQQVATVRLVDRHDVDDPDIPADLQTSRLTLETA